MSEGVEADDVVAVISEHRRCDIGIAGRRTKRANNGSESNASNVGESGGDDAFHDDVDMDAERFPHIPGPLRFDAPGTPTFHTSLKPATKCGKSFGGL